MKLEQKIISIIQDNIDFAEEICVNDHLMDDLNVDSISMLMILNDIEDEFSIQIDESEIEGIERVSDIVDRIGSLMLV
jgi:acyl carrier protein